MFTHRRSGLSDTLKNVPSRRSREIKKDRDEERPRDNHRATSRQKQRHRYYSDDEEENDKTIETKNDDQKLNQLLETLKIDESDKKEDVEEKDNSKDESKEVKEEEPVTPVRERRAREPSESPVRERRVREPSESPVRERRKSSNRRSRHRDDSESPVRDRTYRYRDDSESPVRTTRRKHREERRYRDDSVSPVRELKNRRMEQHSETESENEHDDESTLLKLSKNTISRLAKVSRVPSMASNVYDGLRALAGEFIIEIIESANRRSNNEPISFSTLEPILERRIGSEIPDLENTEISITLFSNFVKEIAIELKTQIKKEAILYLHNATEYYLLKTLRRAVDMSKNARRSRVTMNDVVLASGR